MVAWNYLKLSLSPQLSKTVMFSLGAPFVSQGSWNAFKLKEQLSLFVFLFLVVTFLYCSLFDIQKYECLSCMLYSNSFLVVYSGRASLVPVTRPWSETKVRNVFFNSTSVNLHYQFCVSKKFANFSVTIRINDNIAYRIS